MTLIFEPGKRGGPEKEKPLAYYDMEGPTRNLRFVQSDGKQLFLNYGYLVGGEFLPLENKITLTYTSHIITLKGHNLAPLFDSLATHSLRLITMVEERYIATEDEAGSYVTEIRVRGI